MADSPSDPESNDPFSGPESSEPFSGSSRAGPGQGQNAPPWEQEGDDPFAGAAEDGGMSPSFALKMARLWVKEHQKASMLGAFAAGVFIGAMVRD